MDVGKLVCMIDSPIKHKSMRVCLVIYAHKDKKKII